MQPILAFGQGGLRLFVFTGTEKQIAPLGVVPWRWCRKEYKLEEWHSRAVGSFRAGQLSGGPVQNAGRIRLNVESRIQTEV